MLKELLPTDAEREIAHKNYLHPEIVLHVSLGVSDNRHHGKLKENWMNLLKITEDVWLVTYYIEHELELKEHYKTREAALIEMDRIMSCEIHNERVVAHCYICHATFDAHSVGITCPMCGYRHDCEDGGTGWDLWHLTPEWYAEQMAGDWAKHLEWRKEQGL